MNRLDFDHPIQHAVSRVVHWASYVFGVKLEKLLDMGSRDDKLGVRHARAFVLYELRHREEGPVPSYGQLAGIFGITPLKVQRTIQFEEAVRERFPWPSLLHTDLRVQRAPILGDNPPVTEDDVAPLGLESSQLCREGRRACEVPSVPH